jgi:hypothetical protein
MKLFTPTSSACQRRGWCSFTAPAGFCSLISSDLHPPRRISTTTRPKTLGAVLKAAQISWYSPATVSVLLLRCGGVALPHLHPFGEPQARRTVTPFFYLTPSSIQTVRVQVTEPLLNLANNSTTTLPRVREAVQRAP